MGLYCEPTEDKVAWIERVGNPWNTGNIPEGTLPVARVHQGFVALGVAYNKKELHRFQQGRPDAIWYLVPKVVLREVVPGAKKMKEFK